MAGNTMDDLIQYPAGNGAAGHLDDEKLNAFLAAPFGDLDDRTRAAIDAHLTTCAQCRDRLADLATTVALLRALPDVAPPRSFALTPETIAGGAPARRPKALPRQPIWMWPARWASIAAAFLLALTIGLDLHDGGAPSVNVAATQQTVQAVATPTAPAARTAAPGETPLVAFGAGSAIIIGTPIPVAEPAPAPAPFSAVGTERDWHEAETGLGVLALIAGFVGFLLPPALRRRVSAAA